MRLRVERQEFVDAVGWVTRAAGARPSLPALAGVLLDASSGRLTLGSTDLEMAAETAIPATIERDGRVLLAARFLAQLVARFPDAPVEIEDDGERVRLSCGKATFRVRRLNAEDFPSLPTTGPQAIRGVVKADAFVRLVGQVGRAAAGPDEGRPVLAGVRLEAADGRLTAAATDTFRLATRSLAWDEPLVGEAIVPARALQEAAKAAGEHGGTVAIVLDPGQVTFEFDDRRLTTRLIDGTYPPYRSLFPEAHEVTVTVDRDALTEALQRIAVVASAQTNTPVLLSIEADGLDVRASNQEAGDAAERVDADVEGGAMEIAFNPTFLLAGLDAAGTPRVRLELRDGLRAAVLRPASEDGSGGDVDDFLYLLMPMRVN